MDPDAKLMLQAASKYSYLGIFFGIAIVIGYFSGRWLDGRYHTAPWLSLIGLGIGIAAGFRELIRLARQGLRDEERNEQQNPTDPSGPHNPNANPKDTTPRT
jgi:ATP synthase protein I